MGPQHTKLPQYTTQLQLLIMLQLYTNQSYTQLQLTTSQLLITNQPMMAQLFTNMVMLFKMTTPRLTLPLMKTVTGMLSLVNTVLLFPMAVPKLLPTPLTDMTAMSLTLNTKVLPNTQNTNQLHTTLPNQPHIMPKTATFCLDCLFIT